VRSNCVRSIGRGCDERCRAAGAAQARTVGVDLNVALPVADRAALEVEAVDPAVDRLDVLGGDRVGQHRVPTQIKQIPGDDIDRSHSSG
jgi:hypothetical protein